MNEKSNKNLISIVLPVYNGSTYISCSIDSILAQTYPNWELIIVDDASTDETPSIISEYAKKDSRIKIHTNSENLKLPESLNTGFRMAGGNYFTWTSDDNMFRPTALERMLAAFEAHPEVSMVYTEYDFIDENDAFVRKSFTREIRHLASYDVCGACFLYTADVARKTGEYDSSVFLAEDYDYWIRLAQHGNFFYLKENLYQYRTHSSSLSQTRRKDVLSQTLRVLEKNFDFLYSWASQAGLVYQFFHHIMECTTQSEQKVILRRFCEANPRFRQYIYLRNLKQTLSKAPVTSSLTNCYRFLKKKFKKICLSRKPALKPLAIWGWWQGNNLGDNWIKKTLAGLFPNAVFIDTDTKDLSPYKFVICGGGGLFVTEITPPWNRLPKKLNFGMLGLGAEFDLPKEGIDALAENASFFFVRDLYSLQCMHLENSERSYDLTFLNPLEIAEQPENPKEKLFFIWRDGHNLLGYEQFNSYICPVSSQDSVSHPPYSNWRSVLRAHFNIIVEDDFQTNMDDIEKRTCGMTFVVSGRYHGIIAAIQMGIPFIAIDICPKIRSLTRECGLEKYCIKISEADRLSALIDDACENISSIREKELAFREMAHSTITRQAEYAKQLIDGISR